jgi:hypothetical protein
MRYSQSVFGISVEKNSYLAVRGQATSSDIAANQTILGSMSSEQAYLLVAALYNLVPDQAAGNAHLENGPSS